MSQTIAPSQGVGASQAPCAQGVAAPGRGQDQPVSLTAVSAISAMVAPVVLITTSALLSNGLLAVYGSVNDRMREMTSERLALLSGSSGEFLSQTELSAVRRERLAEIDQQLPMLVRRHSLIKHTVLILYVAVAILGLGVIAIAVAVSAHSEGIGNAALGLVLAGTMVLISGLLVAARSLARSNDAISYAVSRTSSLRDHD
jgi:hypothetical protein